MASRSHSAAATAQQLLAALQGWAENRDRSHGWQHQLTDADGDEVTLAIPDEQ